MSHACFLPQKSVNGGVTAKETANMKSQTSTSNIHTSINLYFLRSLSIYFQSAWSELKIRMKEYSLNFSG